MDILMDINQKQGGLELDKKRNAGDFFKNVLG
jgi:hypothetical protein